mmetsp:Transcript_57901/g.130857  ORF Transcript_57901/g.130857 Transcript_57901/m.130857 type:complete len:788 (-) Transcript_57901:152-2515(-)
MKGPPGSAPHPPSSAVSSSNPRRVSSDPGLPTNINSIGTPTSSTRDFGEKLKEHFSELQGRILSEHINACEEHDRRLKRTVSGLCQQNWELLEQLRQQAETVERAPPHADSDDGNVVVAVDADSPSPRAHPGVMLTMQPPATRASKVSKGEETNVAPSSGTLLASHFEDLGEHIASLARHIGVAEWTHPVPKTRPEGRLEGGSISVQKKSTGLLMRIENTGSNLQQDHDYKLLNLWLDSEVRSASIVDYKTLEDINPEKWAEEAELENHEEEPKAWFVIHPESRPRLAWDVLGMLVLFYDLVSIPLLFAFTFEETPFLTFAKWFTVLFWTTDMGWSSVTGFYRKNDGVPVLNLVKIWRNYAMSWFFLDIAIVGVDWILIAFNTSGKDNANSPMKTGRLLRALRILRIVRLLRLAKLQKIIRMFQDRVDSEYLTILFNVCKLLIMIIAINHIVACAWYKLGSADFSSGESSWTSVEFQQEETILYKYMTSLHWSLTQFTPASMSVNPQNVTERIFAVVILLFAMVVFSSFVSSITGAMTNLRNLGAKQSTQFWTLRKYFRQQRISMELSRRVFRYVNAVLMTAQTQIKENEVELLHLLSQPLKSEVQTELYNRGMHLHPFMMAVAKRSKAVMRKICLTAISATSVSKMDVVFTNGEAARFMYFLTRGALAYVRSNGTEVPMTLRVGHWCCEAVLWTEWLHHGHLFARKETDLLKLSAQKFQTVASEHPSEMAFYQQYAAEFVIQLNDLERQGQSSDVGPEVEAMIQNDACPTKDRKSLVTHVQSLGLR